MVGLGLLVLRLVLATVLIAHGSHTLFGVFAGAGVGPGGLTHAAAALAALGLPSPFLLALAGGLLQFGGGLLLGIGYFTRAAAVALGVFYLAAIWVDAARWGFFLNWTNDPTRGHGMEYAIMMVGTLASLVLSGAGEWSLDGRRARSAATRAAGRARLRDRI